MKTVCKQDMCTGCMACADKCPKQAVSVKDDLTHLNAVIDESRCVQCGLCERVCQQVHPVQKVQPLAWYEGWANDSSIREKASSGGIATAVMFAFVREGGVVCSCTFTGGTFCYALAETEAEIRKFTGSKYVKSNPKGIYPQMLQKLKDGKKVLFVGLPCQAAAAKCFAGEQYEAQLYTADLICHGSPSPVLLETYLQQHGKSLQQMQEIGFRQSTAYRLTENGKPLTNPRLTDRYAYSFLKSLNLTENCYACPYADAERAADLTLGDSWGTQLNDEKSKGVSLILCQTEKGKALLEAADLHLTPADAQRAVETNHQLKAPSQKPACREQFFALYGQGVPYDKIMAKCYPKVFLKQRVKALLLKLKLLH